MKKLVMMVMLVAVVVVAHARKTEKVKNQPLKSEGQATMVVNGVIADEQSGEPLAGVEVKLEGTDRKVYTDFDGHFSFDGLKPGQYKVVTRYISYEQAAKELNVAGSTGELKIKLQSMN